jgi:hypothetical protein
MCVLRTTVFLLMIAMSQVTARGEGPSLGIVKDEEQAFVSAQIDGAEVLAYQYGEAWAIPHIHPLRSPSGKLLTVQRTEPYPHHRSFWIVDRVQMEGQPDVDFYHCWKNYRTPEQPESGYRHFIEHVGFREVTIRDDHISIVADARWVVNENVPVLDDAREMRVHALGDGEYLIDLTFALTASYGDVTFRSDWVHYAWPYLRMHPQFSGASGGVITDDRGRTGQAETNGEYARWIDYSNTVDGVTEGLAVFVYPDGQKRKWLTREYGTFGPRRPDELSGTGFVLKEGESIHGRVAVLVHRGDVEGGRVAERYADYVSGLDGRRDDEPAG